MGEADRKWDSYIRKRIKEEIGYHSISARGRKYSDIEKYVGIICEEAISDQLDYVRISSRIDKNEADYLVSTLHKRIASVFCSHLYQDFYIDADLLSELSYMTYEGEKNRALLLFSDSGIDPSGNDKESLLFQNKQLFTLERSNLKTIRKYATACREGYGLLFIREREAHQRMMNSSFEPVKAHCNYIMVGYRMASHTSGIHVRLMNGGKWNIGFDRGTVSKDEFTIDWNKVFFPRDQNNEMTQKVSKLFRCEERYRDEILNFIQTLSEQKHGTSVIFMENNKKSEDEVKRLATKNRGILITKKLKDFQKDNVLLNQITRIDGALIVMIPSKPEDEPVVRCFSAIVDGEAIIAGNLGRGARYNAVKNYLHTIHVGNACALIYSEDGGIDYVKPRAPSQTPK